MGAGQFPKYLFYLYFIDFVRLSVKVYNKLNPNHACLCVVDFKLCCGSLSE